MAVIDLGKIAITLEGEWAGSRAYEKLSLVIYKGESYISLKDTLGDQPSDGSLSWMRVTERGESLYQMMVREGKFVGTEEQFLAEYQKLIDSLKAEILNAQTKQAEMDAHLALVKDEEDKRVLADKERGVNDEQRGLNESRRQDAEHIRETNEANRKKNDTQRTTQYADMMTQLESATRLASTAASDCRTQIDASVAQNAAAKEATDETNRLNAEMTLNETSRENSERTRGTNEVERGKAETARENAESARDTAEKARVTAEGLRASAESARKTEEGLRALAETARKSAEEQRGLDEVARITAESQRVQEHQSLKESSETATANANSAALAATNATNSLNAKIDPVIASDRKQNEQIRALESDVNDLKQHHGSDFCVGSWDDCQLAPEALEVKGSRDFALAWFPWLVDMTDNAGPVVTKARLLKKNNWFRYADGTFAPAVCITPEDWALCDAELYLDSGHTQKYCEAGAFDAEAFYNEHGVDTALYGVDGVAIAHIRRPWETTNKDLSNFIGRKDTIYLCDNLMGRSGKILKGVFGSQTNFDGAQFGQFKLPPTGIAPTPVCTVGGKTRSFFYLMKGETNCTSHSGAGDITHMFDSLKMTFPRVDDMNQINDMKWSRANNADPNSPIPFAEGGYHALNAFLDSMEVAYGTRYLHKDDFFTSGISSNDTCSSETSWLDRGGVRYRKTGASTWDYATWATTPEFCYDSNGKKTNLSESLNYYYPKAGVNEGQIAASYAVERGIPEGQRFELYGSIYYWKSVNGATRLDAGEMNARIYKIVTGTVNAFHADGTPGTWEIETILRIGIIQGMNIVGDIWAYWGGGYEQIGHVTDASQTNGKYGSDIGLYLQPDQSKWLNESITNKREKELFDFEKSYIYLGRTTNERNSGDLRRMRYGAFPEIFGASSYTGECHYMWCDNWWGSSVGSKYRIAARFRAHAHLSSCAPRSLSAHSNVLSTTRFYAGSAQVLLGAPECNALQAQD